MKVVELKKDIRSVKDVMNEALTIDDKDITEMAIDGNGSIYIIKMINNKENKRWLKLVIKQFISDQ